VNLAFIVGRNIYFKFYAPVIEAALQRGWEVECWLRLAKSSKGPKAYQHPTLDDVPAFQHGSVKVRRYVENRDCLDLAKSSVNAVVSLHSRQFYFSEPTPNCRFVTLQQGLDSFIVTDPRSLASSDLLCFYAPFWVEWAASYYAASDQCNPQQLRQLLRDKVAYTGFPQQDVLFHIDPTTVRRRWGIPLEQPIVLLLPITLANKAGAWSRFFAARSHLHQAITLGTGGVLEDWNLIGQYRSWITNGWNDHSLTEAIRSFCDHNGAYLIAKGRLKDPIRPHLLAAADKALYDDSYYPATILEAMSIADLCIHFYSTAAIEAAYAGIPGLCVHRPSPRIKARAERPVYHQLWRTNWPGNAYNYEGVNYWMTIPQVITELPGMSLTDFRLDPNARFAYLKQYVGPADGNASQRVLDAIVKRIEQ
jgi:hypothetical protein